ncbi:MAG: M20/M25/M40 family metallo-hydrolase [Gammaproteobacteria bacterium]
MNKANILAQAILLLLLLCLASNIWAGLPDDGAIAKTFRAKVQRIESRIRKLAEFGRNSEGGVSRVAFSEADVQGREYIISLMKEAGLEVRIDTAGNILGLRKGKDATLPPILFGSHIDSVPSGGNYDGDVGVIGALECMQVLDENNFNTRHSLEMVVFSDEEGIFAGSRAMVGDLTPVALEGMSHSGMTIAEAICMKYSPTPLDAMPYPQSATTTITASLPVKAILC